MRAHDEVMASDGADRDAVVMLTTERLELHTVTEEHRDWFVAAFQRDEFMVYSEGTLDVAGAHARFDRMVRFAAVAGHTKRPVVERSSGEVIGYCGTSTIEHRRRTIWEIGWRIIDSARGQGYAAEAAQAVLDHARHGGPDEIWAIIDPRNEPSKAVARRTGFEFRVRSVVKGSVANMYLWTP